MDIQYAILGLLSWQPFTGYDLKRFIAESDLFYWSGNNNQIYNSLVELHQAGLVTQEIQYQESLPAKKIYTITELGRAALRRRALADPELAEIHHNFLIQLAWTDDLSSEELDGLLARYEEEVRVQVLMRQKARAGPIAAAPNRSRRERFLWERIADHLQAGLERELEWVRSLRVDISADFDQKG